MKELVYEKNELSAKLIAAEAKVFHSCATIMLFISKIPAFFYLAET